jgi:hypothetical protein
MRLAAALAVAALLAAGVLWLGRIAADDRQAMLLTTGWFVLVAATGLLPARRRRDLLAPMALGYAAVAIAVAVVLARPMFFDDVVDERVVRGTPVSVAGERAANTNVELAEGSFEGVRHDGSGGAAIVQVRGGERKLTLTEFETDNGPDLFVYLAAGSPTEEDQVTDYVDLGRLKGNKGNQQYTIPAGVDTRRYSTVVVWCRAFTVLFTRAELRPS